MFTIRVRISVLPPFGTRIERIHTSQSPGCRPELNATTPSGGSEGTGTIGGETPKRTRVACSHAMALHVSTERILEPTRPIVFVSHVFERAVAICRRRLADGRASWSGACFVCRPWKFVMERSGRSTTVPVHTHGFGSRWRRRRKRALGLCGAEETVDVFDETSAILLGGAETSPLQRLR